VFCGASRNTTLWQGVLICYGSAASGWPKAIRVLAVFFHWVFAIAERTGGVRGVLWGPAPPRCACPEVERCLGFLARPNGGVGDMHSKLGSNVTVLKSLTASGWPEAIHVLAVFFARVFEIAKRTGGVRGVLGRPRPPVAPAR
jgi:hypothetical protein